MQEWTTALVNATVFTGERVHEDCSVLIRDGSIADLVPDGAPVRGGGTVINMQGRRLAPGFIDIQVNGGGGVLFNNSPTVDALRTISAAHARFGTTAFLPTLISDRYDVMRSAIDAVRQAAAERVPGILGIHLEGPFLNLERRGAHAEGMLREMDEEGMQILISLGPGLVTLTTLAPEKAEPELIGRLCAAGVVVFGGHSAAGYEQCRDAMDAGMKGFTHLYNGMGPVSGRDPGMVGAALASSDCVFSIIADGYHVHPALLRLALSSREKGAALLVTDAMATVGSADPSFDLYGRRVALDQGVLRDERGSLAASNLGMIDAVRNIMRLADLHWTEAVRMASSYPARAIGVDSDRGFVLPGFAADLVELDAEMVLYRIWVGGIPVAPTAARPENVITIK